MSDLFWALIHLNVTKVGAFITDWHTSLHGTPICPSRSKVGFSVAERSGQHLQAADIFELQIEIVSVTWRAVSISWSLVQ